VSWAWSGTHFERRNRPLPWRLHRQISDTDTGHGTGSGVFPVGWRLASAGLGFEQSSSHRIPRVPQHLTPVRLGATAAFLACSCPLPPSSSRLRRGYNQAPRGGTSFAAMSARYAMSPGLDHPGVPLCRLECVCSCRESELSAVTTAPRRWRFCTSARSRSAVVEAPGLGLLRCGIGVDDRRTPTARKR
jgi:hypothetical protein